jgi:cold shock CspA family protein
MNKGFGYILSDDGGPDVRVQRIVIVPASASGLPSLFGGQLVEYQVDASGSASAVRSRQQRIGGTVLSFSEQKGTGTIRLDETNRTAEVHYRNIEPPHARRRRLREGEPVELSIEVSGNACHVLRLDPRPALYRFSEARSITAQKFQILVGPTDKPMAEAEQWDYENSPTGDLPILRYYIFKTFERAQAQNIIYYDEGKPEDSQRACFNTGLVTNWQEEIFGVFTRNKTPGPETPWRPKWWLEGFFKKSDWRLSEFAREHLELPTYFATVSEVYLDLSETPIAESVEHIILDNLDRFPAKLQTPELARAALSRAIADAKRRLRRNYKTVVPQFNEGEIQLLLPLALEDPGRVDRALVLRREGKRWKGATIFYLDWAYRNARVVAKPDKEWLHPVRIEGEGALEGQEVEPEEVLAGEDGQRETESITESREDEALSSVPAGPRQSADDSSGERNPVDSVQIGRVTRVEKSYVYFQVNEERGRCHIRDWSGGRYVLSLADEAKNGDEFHVKILERTHQGLVLRRVIDNN